MQFQMTAAMAFAILAAPVLGIDVAIYNSINRCDSSATPDEYAEYQGSGNFGAITVGGAPPSGYTCDRYANNGNTPEDCSGELTGGATSFVIYGSGSCLFSNNANGGPYVIQTERSSSGTSTCYSLAESAAFVSCTD